MFSIPKAISLSTSTLKIAFGDFETPIPLSLQDNTWAFLKCFRHQFVHYRLIRPENN